MPIDLGLPELANPRRPLGRRFPPAVRPLPGVAVPGQLPVADVPVLGPQPPIEPAALRKVTFADVVVTAALLAPAWVAWLITRRSTT